jgi:CheY-like chemotaxis protein
MIEQIIVNLAINSRDAMQRGGRIVVRVEPRRVEASRASRNPDATAGEFLCLTVSDNGCGVSPEAMGHLFEPFFTTKSAGKGTGLGLATVYGIVKQHRGWIEVRSEVNLGTTFDIYFPLSAEPGAAPAEDKIQPIMSRGDETILVAEDEPSLREMVADLLTLRGYRVLAAETGPAALEIARKEKHVINLLLTDMIMPGGMMGTDLAAELRRTRPTMKIIYTTGYSPGATGLQKDLGAGVRFLPKPYSPERLAQVVRNCLDG